MTPASWYLALVTLGGEVFPFYNDNNFGRHGFFYAGYILEAD